MELSGDHHFQQTLFLQGTMRYLIPPIFCLFCLPFLALAQEYSYTQYDSKNGLAGSTVYCMTQDKDGFLWFGTETGLSRFDGTHFKNFTTDDGLPSNEIIQLFTDTKGRVWIAPFKKTISYYYKGKIYTQENDQALQGINFNNFIIKIVEDADGNILMAEPHRLHLLTAGGKSYSIDSILGKRISFVSIGGHSSGGFRVIVKNNVYHFYKNRFTLMKTVKRCYEHFHFFQTDDKIQVWRSDTLKATTEFLPTGKTQIIPYTNNHEGFSIIDDSNVALCRNDGVSVFNIHKPGSVQHFLHNIPVNTVLKDFENNLWFSTVGQGVYRLSSPFVLNVAIRKKGSFYAQQVLSLKKNNKHILAGCNLNSIARFDAETGKQDKTLFLLPGVGPVVAMAVLPGHKVISGTSSFLTKLSEQMDSLKLFGQINVKAVAIIHKKVLVATGSNIVTFDPERFRIIDTLWSSRATTLLVEGDTVYFGALNGVHRILPDRSVQYLGDNLPECRHRITALQRDDNGVLWIATYDMGLIGYKNGRIVARLNKKNGLSSNICRTIFLSGHNLWVGTDKGLNKINLAAKNSPIQKFTTGDGLGSDIINALHVEGNRVFVGTSQGLTFFDEKKLNNTSRCDLLFTDIAISGQSRQWDSTGMVIPHASNNIRFDFVAISFKSAGDIRYRYRLLGLDSNWKETRETFLSYPTLPSGEYELQLQAINKFDVHSQVITARFTIEPLLLEKTWFRILAGVVFLGMTGLLVWFIIRRIRKREEEKTAINKKIGELEQLARKAQMNPHFIFNSLNSIQQYVMDADLAGANKFISGFSRLIRQTLDFSSRQEINLEEELDYLKNYLELEKTRLEDAFSWQVIIAPGIHPADYYLPPMILQPFVENSVRHGVRLRKDKKGRISIMVRKENNDLICILEDNGVGRKVAMQFKSSSHIEYQSKGMSLTAERIEVLNKDNADKITIKIEDLEDDQQHALGTRVTLRFPVFV
jgi:ligand-binding sensor domain-containing protein